MCFVSTNYFVAIDFAAFVYSDHLQVSFLFQYCVCMYLKGLRFGLLRHLMSKLILEPAVFRELVHTVILTRLKNSGVLKTNNAHMVSMSIVTDRRLFKKYTPSIDESIILIPSFLMHRIMCICGEYE